MADGWQWLYTTTNGNFGPSKRFSNVCLALIGRNYSNLILKLLKEQEELVHKKDYSNLNEIESELEEIQKRTKSTDPNSAFAIAMSAKHKTLTKR